MTQIDPQWYTLLAGPVLWTIYFLVVYVIVEFGCRGGWLTGRLLGWPAASVITVILTIAALAGGGAVTYGNWRRWQRVREQSGEATWHETHGRRPFMELAGLMLAVLFTYLILLTGIPALVLNPCSY